MSGQLHVPGRKGSTKEGDGTDTLVENCAEARARCITIDVEQALEVWQLEDGGHVQHLLEGVEGGRGQFRPQEGVLPKEQHEWCSDDTKILGEAVVVSHQAKEATKVTYGAWLWPGRRRVHLVLIHGHSICGDHVAKIGHEGRGKGGFATLDAQLVLASIVWTAFRC
jgi:hypothetical protein